MTITRGISHLIHDAPELAKVLPEVPLELTIKGRG